MAVSGHVGVTAAAPLQHVLRLTLAKAPRVNVVGVELEVHALAVAPRRLQVLCLYAPYVS